MAIVFKVIGRPAPKGSPRVVTRGKNGQPLPVPRVLKDTKKTEAWHTTVTVAARQAMKGYTPFVKTPLIVQADFFLRRPAGHYQKNGALRKSAPSYPCVKPDLDKLLRSTMDPLEGVIFDGDSRIVAHDAIKHYARLGEPERVHLVVCDAGFVDDGFLQRCRREAIAACNL